MPTLLTERGRAMDDCIFCKIVNGSIPADRVYEDNYLIAIRDIKPVAPTHVLIIPKVHIPTLDDIDSLQNDIIASILKSAKTIAQKEGLSGDGYRVVINCNRAGGQEVFHLHVHVLGGRKMGAMG